MYRNDVQIQLIYLKLNLDSTKNVNMNRVMNRDASVQFICNKVQSCGGKTEVKDDIVTIEFGRTVYGRYDMEIRSDTFLSALIDPQWDYVDKSLILHFKNVLTDRTQEELNCEQWFKRHFTTCPTFCFIYWSK